LVGAEIEPVRAKASPLAEVPFAALKAAAGFADYRHEQFDAVHLRPGHDEGVVVISAACSARGIEVTCEGVCQRHVALPVTGLLASLRRHRDAQHVAMAKTDAGLSVRTYSPTATVITTIPESGGVPMTLPAAPAGEFEIDPLYFNPTLLIQTLRDIQPAETVGITPFSMGWQIKARCDEFEAVCVIAGMRG
jgi:hypothetical protein